MISIASARGRRTNQDPESLLAAPAAPDVVAVSQYQADFPQLLL